jgi:hypothetical protein
MTQCFESWSRAANVHVPHHSHDVLTHQDFERAAIPRAESLSDVGQNQTILVGMPLQGDAEASKVIGVSHHALPVTGWIHRPGDIRQELPGAGHEAQIDQRRVRRQGGPVPTGRGQELGGNRVVDRTSTKGNRCRHSQSNRSSDTIRRRGSHQVACHCRRPIGNTGGPEPPRDPGSEGYSECGDGVATPLITFAPLRGGNIQGQLGNDFRICTCVEQRERQGHRSDP